MQSEWQRPLTGGADRARRTGASGDLGQTLPHGRERSSQSICEPLLGQASLRGDGAHDATSPGPLIGCLSCCLPAVMIPRGKRGRIRGWSDSAGTAGEAAGSAAPVGIGGGAGSGGTEGTGGAAGSAGTGGAAGFTTDGGVGEVDAADEPFDAADCPSTPPLPVECSSLEAVCSYGRTANAKKGAIAKRKPGHATPSSNCNARAGDRGLLVRRRFPLAGPGQRWRRGWQCRPIASLGYCTALGRPMFHSASTHNMNNARVARQQVAAAELRAMDAGERASPAGIADLQCVTRRSSSTVPLTASNR